jgi:transposase
MDMWPAFFGAVGEALPDAEVVFDRFHVSKHMGDAASLVRRFISVCAFDFDMTELAV